MVGASTFCVSLLRRPTSLITLVTALGSMIASELASKPGLTMDSHRYPDPPAFVSGYSDRR